VTTGSLPAEGRQPRGVLRSTVRDAAAGASRFVMAGALSGLVVGGVGSRVAMRVTALMTADALHGTLTEADAVVGQFTIEGSAFLLFFATLIGAGGGIVAWLVRPWLGGGRWVGLRFGVLCLAIGGTSVVTASNFDFRRFGSPTVNVAMYVTLFITYGVVAAAGWERLRRRALPRVAQLLALAFGAWAMLGAIAVGLDSTGSLSSLHAFAAVLVVAAGARGLAAWRQPDAPLSPTVVRAGEVVLGALASIGLLGLATEVAAILG
jgi:hypothetical protein